MLPVLMEDEVMEMAALTLTRKEEEMSPKIRHAVFSICFQ